MLSKGFCGIYAFQCAYIDGKAPFQVSKSGCFWFDIRIKRVKTNTLTTLSCRRFAGLRNGILNTTLTSCRGF